MSRLSITDISYQCRRNYIDLNRVHVGKNLFTFADPLFGTNIYIKLLQVQFFYFFTHNYFILDIDLRKYWGLKKPIARGLCVACDLRRILSQSALASRVTSRSSLDHDVSCHDQKKKKFVMCSYTTIKDISLICLIVSYTNKQIPII